MIRSSYFRLIALCAFLVCSVLACGPSLRSEIRVPDIPDVNISAKTPRIANEVEVSLSEVLDTRSSLIMVQYGKKTSVSEGDVTWLVREALEGVLTDAGFIIKSGAPISIGCELRVWQASVSGSLPTKIDSKAEISIDVRDPAGELIYSSEFQGFFMEEQGTVNVEDIRKNLGVAMAEAIKQVMLDKQLFSLLSSF